MSLRYAIVGVLLQEPMHGYRLRTALHARLGPLWSVTGAQIYQALAALERRCFVESHDERVGRRPIRRVYRATSLGRRGLERWLSRPKGTVRSWEDVAIRCMLLRAADAPALWRALLERERAARRRLDAAAAPRPDPECAAGAFDVRTPLLEGLVHHAEAHVLTLAAFRARLEAWARERDIDLAGPAYGPLGLPPPACLPDEGEPSETSSRATRGICRNGMCPP